MHIRFHRRGLAALAVSASLLAAVVPGQAFAFDTASSSAVNVDAKGVAVHGYDPVAYFTSGAATPGKPEFSAEQAGVKYQFVSAENRDAFKADPAKYEPQYGGFCALGVAFDQKFDGDPNAWHIADGKLYLNVNKTAQKRWLEDVPGNIKTAEGNWTQVKDKAPKDLK